MIIFTLCRKRFLDMYTGGFFPYNSLEVAHWLSHDPFPEVGLYPDGENVCQPKIVLQFPSNNADVGTALNK